MPEIIKRAAATAAQAGVAVLVGAGASDQLAELGTGPAGT